MKFLAPSKMKFHPLLKLLVPLIEALPKCGTTLDDRDAYRVRYKYVHFIFTSSYLILESKAKVVSLYYVK